MYKLYCRSYQKVLQFVSPLLPWRKPELIEGENSLGQLPNLIKSKGIVNVLIVTDKGLSAIGLLTPLLNGLQSNQIRYTIYDETVPNPTIENIEDALNLYKKNNCQAIIAFGGGSPIDCAKGVAARIARPDKTIPQMKGQLKIRRKIPLLFAVPTTAGTGSEATVAAVISNSKTREKYAINDLSLIPHYAVLDPLLTIKLPPSITAETGMDALTHAVEAYIGRGGTPETDRCCEEAVRLIFLYLEQAYKDGENLEARKEMQKAAYLAGVAFTRAYVGYVHAIAHTLGGFYSVPHGLANAILLPYVLEYYGDSIDGKLAALADAAGIGQPSWSEKEKAAAFIASIKDLNKSLNIPDKIHCIEEEDMPTMIDRAYKEANPFYPVPRILNKKDLHQLYCSILQ